LTTADTIHEAEGRAESDDHGAASTPMTGSTSPQGSPSFWARLRTRRAFRNYAIAILYLITSSAVLQGFLTQWGSRIGADFPQTLAFAGPRPYVYRVLMPLLVNGITNIIPLRIGRALMRVADGRGRNVVGLAMQRYDWPGPPDLHVLVAMGVIFSSLWLTAWVWRSLIRWAFPERPFWADTIPALALLATSVSFVRGGYLYDFPDMCLISACFLALMQRRWVAWYLLLTLAMLNKEASLLTLVWFLAIRGELSRRSWWAHAVASGGIASGMVLAVWHRFHKNPGGTMELHFADNLRYWASLRWLADIQDSFATGIAIPSALNAVNVILLVGVLVYGRNEVPRYVFRAFLWSVLAVSPLFLVFGFQCEVRVFSTAIPSLLLLGVGALKVLYPSTDLAAATAPRSESLPFSTVRKRLSSQERTPETRSA
jgi:hypothetical protein